MVDFVSVIIPVYNDQSGVDLCLEALDKQDYPPHGFEVVVIDNRSKPPIRLEKRYGFDVRRVVCSTPGSYAARNAGVQAARGNIFAFTDADCVPNGDWLTNGVAALGRNGMRSIVGGEVVLTISEKPTATELYQSLVGFMQRENIEHRGFSVTANLFVSRERFAGIGPFNEALLSSGDAEWCWRAQSVGVDVIYSVETLVRTSPRTSLRAAIRQTRRVAGGRALLRELRLPHVGSSGTRPHRTLWKAVSWVLLHPKLQWRDRLRVFAVAFTLKVAQWLETVRLRLGARPERR